MPEFTSQVYFLLKKKKRIINISFQYNLVSYHNNCLLKWNTFCSVLPWKPIKTAELDCNQVCNAHFQVVCHRKYQTWSETQIPIHYIYSKTGQLSTSLTLDKCCPHDAGIQFIMYSLIQFRTDFCFRSAAVDISETQIFFCRRTNGVL